MSWEIEYFELESGEQPAETFEDGIPKKLRGKLIEYAKKVAATEGKGVGGYWKAVRGFSDLFAIRVIFGNDLGRYYTTRDGNRLVLLHGYQKRPGHPTPSAVFRLADRYKDDYNRNRRVSPEVPPEPQEGDRQ